METKKQTAVQWLDIQFKKGVDCNPLDISCHAKAYDNLFQQAIAMEKEQIEDAAGIGHFEGMGKGPMSSIEYFQYAVEFYKQHYGQ